MHLLPLILALSFMSPSMPALSGPGGCKHCIILAEQSQNSIVVVNADSDKIVWKWDPAGSNVRPEHLKWFNAPSDAKCLPGCKYILMTASGGGVALIRVSDSVTVFYAFAGGNTHSAEMLPDGNIVAASSTGNFMTVFRTDTVNYPEGVIAKKIPLRFGHNVVWDKKRKILFSTAMDHLVYFRYNFDTDDPLLTRTDSVKIPGTEAHDLFPVHGRDELWLTTIDDVLVFNPSTRQFRRSELENDRNIKSVSSGPRSFPVIFIRPKVSWWTDEVLDFGEKSIFRHEGYRIYKARWFTRNSFSY